jgi:hypothetical protein
MIYLGTTFAVLFSAACAAIIIFAAYVSGRDLE